MSGLNHKGPRGRGVKDSSEMLNSDNTLGGKHKTYPFRTFKMIQGWVRV